MLYVYSEDQDQIAHARSLARLSIIRPPKYFALVDWLNPNQSAR